MCKIGKEPLSPSKDINKNGIRVVRRIFDANWCTSRICVVAAAFAMAVNVIAEYTKERLMNELLYADDLVLMSESIEKFLKWKEAFKSMG